MRVAILGYGKEGRSAEQYFGAKDAEIRVFDNFTPEEAPKLPLEDFDLILRSPSVHPYSGWSSMTKHFFTHCPCPIIGVTGTKGKGTTCTMLRDILQKLGHKVWLVGNIGQPALDILDQISPEDVVIYELSSFQLWDLEQSPHIAVILKVEPDHLNVHDDFSDYVNAKANIAKWQTETDFCIYYQNNPTSVQIAETSPAQKLAFPIKDSRSKLDQLLNHLSVVGEHNREDAEAALLAAACYHDQGLSSFVHEHFRALASALQNFHSLPHRLEYLRTLNQVDYYDDNFSTTLPSTLVALEAFRNQPIVHIVGGRDKTNNADISDIAVAIQKHTKKAILIGESGHELAKILPKDQFILADSLSTAVTEAQKIAEELVTKASQSNSQENQPNPHPVVLMSPAAASFDMFENVYDRGAKFQKLVQELS